MKGLWRKYADKIDAMPVRERAMVFVAVLAVALYMTHALFIAAPVTQKNALLAKMALQQKELQLLQQRIQALEQGRTNPDAANLARRESIRRQIAEIDDNLKGIQLGLVPAQNMKALLQEMLARNPRLQLVAMRTLPATPLLEKRNKAEKDTAAPASVPPDSNAARENNVFKHGVQITVEGSYVDLHDYVARLEKLSWQMFWSRASLTAEAYPRVTLTVTIYTLSLDKAWLVV